MLQHLITRGTAVVKIKMAMSAGEERGKCVLWFDDIKYAMCI